MTTNSFRYGQLMVISLIPEFVVQQLKCRLFETPYPAAHKASLSFTSSWSLLKIMSIESVMPSNHFILCCPLVLLASIFPSIRIFSNESALHIRQPKYRSFSFSSSPSNIPEGQEIKNRKHELIMNNSLCPWP